MVFLIWTTPFTRSTRFHFSPAASAMRTPVKNSRMKRCFQKSRKLQISSRVRALVGLGSPGVDELRWNLPVRPGDNLTIRAAVLRATRSQSKPDRGIVQSLFEVLNQKRNVVMNVNGAKFILCESPQQGEIVS
jgi:hypothetical protein